MATELEKLKERLAELEAQLDKCPQPEGAVGGKPRGEK